MNGKEKEFELALPEDLFSNEERGEKLYVSKCEVEGKSIPVVEIN